MRSRISVFLLPAVLSIGLSLPAHASELYSNIPADSVIGTINAWDITNYGIADSFTINGSVSVTGITFYTWSASGDLPSGVEWSIAPAPLVDPSDPSTLATGTASLTSIYQSTNGSYDIYANSFSIAPLNLSEGTYWLLFENGAVSGNANPLYWDESDGPSQAFNSAYGGPITSDTDGGCSAASGYCSQSFVIEGEAAESPVPEPAGLAELGAGAYLALMYGGVLRRRLARALASRG